MTPYPHQIEILNQIKQNQRIIINTNERQIGISTIMILFAIEEMIKGNKTFIVSQNSYLSKLLNKKTIYYLTELNIVCECNKKLIRTGNGGFIRFFSIGLADMEFRGWECDNLILEGCLPHLDTIQKTIFSGMMALNVNGKLILTTTGGDSIVLPNFTIYDVDTSINNIISLLNKKNYGISKKIGGIPRIR